MTRQWFTTSPVNTHACGAPPSSKKKKSKKKRRASSHTHPSFPPIPLSALGANGHAEDLPVELWMVICGYLELSDILSLSQVSQYLYHCTSDARVWRDVHLNAKLTDQGITRLLTRLKHTHFLDLGRCSNLTSKGFAQLACLQELRGLKLAELDTPAADLMALLGVSQACGLQQLNVADTLLSTEDVLTALRQFPHLQGLDISCTPACLSMDLVLLRYLTRDMPRLAALDLEGLCAPRLDTELIDANEEVLSDDDDDDDDDDGGSGGSGGSGGVSVTPVTANITTSAHDALGDVPGIHRLNLAMMYPLNRYHLGTVLSFFPAVQNLDLEGISSESVHCRDLRLYHSLAVLNLSGCDLAGRGSELVELASQLPKLSILNCNNITSTSLASHHFHSFFAALGRRLRVLNIGRTFFLDDDTLNVLASHCPSLCHLSLDQADGTQPRHGYLESDADDDIASSDLDGHVPSAPSRVSDGALLALLTSCHQLESLTLRGAARLSTNLVTALCDQRHEVGVSLRKVRLCHGDISDHNVNRLQRARPDITLALWHAR